jgi:lia operon protein LiaG
LKKSLGVVLLLLGASLFVVAIWSSPFAFFRSDVTKIEEQFSMEDIEELELDVTSENLQVVPSDHPQLRLRLTGRVLNYVTFTTEKKGDTVTITVKPKWYASSSTNDLRLIVEVPRKQRIALTTKTNSRVVTIGTTSGEKWAINKLTTDVTNGAYNMYRLQVDQLDYVGNMSEVTMNHVRTKNATLNNSGNVNINHYSGPLQLVSMFGDVRVKMAELVRNIDVQVQSGNFDLYLPSSASFTINAELVKGTLTSKDHTLPLQKRSNTVTTITSGSGRYKIEAKIASGDMTIH